MLAPPLLNRTSMIDPVSLSDNYQMARKLLDASVVRQEAIASNIANVDTPGYRRLDVAPDFATQLRTKLETGKLSEVRSLKPAIVEDLSARSVRPDGNSVEIERELIEMNRNSVEYDYLAEIVTRNIKQMKMAISGRSI
jgi:flagellar basal-body rod protein FlgB